MISDYEKYQRALLKQTRIKGRTPPQVKTVFSANPVPERITLALDLCELYGPEVDESLGVEEPTVDMWESGEIIPTYEQMKVLANLTNFDVKFFYEPMTEDLKHIQDSMLVCGQKDIEGPGYEIMNEFEKQLFEENQLAFF